MPSEQPTPVEIVIYVKPYVRKYVVARLSDPDRLGTDPMCRALYQELERELRGRHLVSVVNDYDPKQDTAETRVRLRVLPRAGQTADMSHYKHRYVTAMLTRAFLKEMYGWVDWYCTRLGMGPKAALETFRKHYSITDSDQSIDTAERMYRYHRTPRRKRRRRKR